MQAEKHIKLSNLINWTIFRVPMIVSRERLGILSLLFDLILLNKKVPLIGTGENILQFLHAEDLSNFIYLSLNINEKKIYKNISDEKISLKSVIEKLILDVNSKSKIILIKDFGVTKILSF